MKVLRVDLHLRRSLAQLSVFKLLMEMQISAAWFDLEWPKVPLEKPCTGSLDFPVSGTTFLMRLGSRSITAFESSLKVESV